MLGLYECDLISSDPAGALGIVLGRGLGVIISLTVQPSSLALCETAFFKHSHAFRELAVGNAQASVVVARALNP